MCACNHSKQVEIVDATNKNLVLDNGILKFENQPFLGYVVEFYNDDKLKSKTQYVNGKKEGFEKYWFKNDSLAIERHYVNGLKIGIHKGWWDNGIPSFEFHFNRNGEYDGVVKEWYKSGQLYRSFNYKDGKESGNQRLWKQDGSIKANYEVVNDERFGLIGLKKCYTVTVGSDNVIPAKAGILLK